MLTTRFTAGVTLVLALLAASGPAVRVAAQGQGAIVPFKIAVPDSVLTDLKDRLARTRLHPR